MPRDPRAPQPDAGRQADGRSTPAKAHGSEGAPVPPERHRRALRCASWLAATILLVAYTYRVSPGGGWNIMTRLALVRAVVCNHRLDITPSARLTQDKAEYPPGSGIYYSDKLIGAQLLGVVGYAVGWYAGRGVLDTTTASGVASCTASWFALAPPTIAAALLMLCLFDAMGLGLRAATFIVLGYGLGTLAWPYSTVYYGHQPAAAFGVSSLALVLLAQRAERRRWVFHGLAGLLAGWAMITEVPAILIGAAVALLVARAGRRALAVFAASAVPPVMLQLAYNWACFGSPFRFGYMYEANPEFANPAGWVALPRWGALVGLTVSPDKGLFFLSPFLLFAVWGLVQGLRGRQWRPEAAVCGAVFAGYLLYNSAHYMWQGGVCFGPRHIVPAIPFLTVGLAMLWPNLSPPLRRVCILLGVWSVLVSFAATETIAEPPANLLTGTAGTAEALLRVMLGTAAWPNLGMLVGLSAGASYAVHGALIAALLALAWRVLTPRVEVSAA